MLLFLKGGSRGSHCEENTGRSGTRYGSHAATPGDSTPTAPQPRNRRPHDRMDIVPTNTATTNPLEDVISSSKYFFLMEISDIY